MIMLAKEHGLDVKVAVATMTLTSSIATSQHLLNIHYFPGTVIDTLHNLSLLLMRHLQSTYCYFTYCPSEEVENQ